MLKKNASTEENKIIRAPQYQDEGNGTNGLWYTIPYHS